MKARCLAVFLAASCVLPVAGWGADSAAVEPATTTAADGEQVSVPARDRVSVLAFVRGGQPQSQLALRQIQSAAEQKGEVEVVVLLSGPHAEGQVDAIRRAAGDWKIVLDPQFALSGKLNVHAWPTTVVIGKDGRELAHLAGAPASLRSDLSAHLDFAGGRIDAATLQQRLENHQVVGDSSHEAAARHLEVARRLMESGKVEQAREQIEAGLKLHADDPALQLALVRVLLLQDQPQAANDVLDRLPAGAAPAWQTNTLRGRAALMAGQWDQARQRLEEALKLNPAPAEAHYLLGIICEQQGDAARAAAEYRAAFESSDTGRKLTLPRPPIRPAAGG